MWLSSCNRICDHEESVTPIKFLTFTSNDNSITLKISFSYFVFCFLFNRKLEKIWNLKFQLLKQFSANTVIHHLHIIASISVMILYTIQKKCKNKNNLTRELNLYIYIQSLYHYVTPISTTYLQISIFRDVV